MHWKKSGTYQKEGGQRPFSCFRYFSLPPITFDTVMSGGGVLVMCWCAGVLMMCWCAGVMVLVMCWYGELVETMVQNVTDLTDI